MPNDDAPSFLEVMQQFVAIEAVGPSAVRRQGGGVLSVIQGCLSAIDLDRMPTDPDRFRTWLNKQAVKLLAAIEGKSHGRPWGTARKAMNLFLRACLYNHYIRRRYGLEKVEKWLEIPLDNVVATALKHEAGRGGLPPWPGLRILSPEVNKQFQAYAECLARARGLPARVHLDMYLWIKNR